MRVGSRKTASGVIAIAGRICVWFCDSQGREGIGDFAFVWLRFASGSPQDAMGSVIGKANGSGASTATIKYDGFGNILDASGPSASIDPSIGSEPRFHGMMLDAATGLYYVRARYYDSQTGRFVTRDPHMGLRGMPESYHPYAFTNGNPYKWRDPSGLVTMGELMVSVAIVSVLATGAIATLHTYLRSTGRSLTDTEKETFRNAFGNSIDLDRVRLSAISQPDARARYAFGGLVLVDTNEFEQGDQSGAFQDYGVIAHELLHMWQYTNRPMLQVTKEVVMAKFDSNAYDIPDGLLYNKNDHTQALRYFVSAPTEKQAELFNRCFGVQTPDCELLRSYIRNPSVATYQTLTGPY